MDDPSTASTQPSTAPPSSSPTSFAFLNHSTATVHDNLPPDVDDKRLARQKRKRTSPEDAAILEAAYHRDPKPDKASRLDLVSQVALDEKGVQIWFQNRRQTSRRKSRPLLPHEVAQYQMSRGDRITLVDYSCGPDVPDDSAIDLTYDQPASFHGNEDTEGKSEQPLPDRSLSVHSENTRPDVVGDSSSTSQGSDSQNSSATVRPTTIASVGYLANRRSFDFKCQELSNQCTLPTATSLIDSKRLMKKSSSFVRLAMNAEGKAEVVTKDASSPSPPRLQQVIYPSIANSSYVTPIPSARRNLQRSDSARSRDSRSWEFCCDKEARSQLGQAAEKDARGSAAGAIGLLRTASGRSVLGSIPSKRNSTLAPQRSSSKRLKLGSKRDPFQRSTTSLGRLQGQDLPRHPKLKQSYSANSSYGKGSSSDKENRSPEPTFDSQAGDDFQQEQTTHDEATVELDGSRMQARDAAQNSGDDPENDDEVMVFMSGGTVRKRGNASGDDLDCVQGLLSLSQGNWR